MPDDVSHLVSPRLKSFRQPAAEETSLDTESVRQLAIDLSQTPMPAKGATLARWRTLAMVASTDLVFSKILESHLDALAILAELQSDAQETLGGTPRRLWGVWSTDAPGMSLLGEIDGGGVVLSGRKGWCSAAKIATHALVTFRTDGPEPWLAAIRLDQPGVHVTGDGWHAVGMCHVGSVDVEFDDVQGVVVGRSGDYLRRQGFWHGAAGIAACWFGGTVPLAQAMARQAHEYPDPHSFANLGRVDAAMQGVRALMRETARFIDEHGTSDCRAHALRLRAATEAMALLVLQCTGNVLGGGPLCRDASLARRFADLPIMIRQSRAEKDLETLGKIQTANGVEQTWRL